MGWNDGLTRPVTLGELGQRYRHYRLADPDAEEAMAGSLRRWGQLSPVVACVRAGKFELIDGFKRFAAAGQIRQLTSLSVRVLEVDEPTAKGSDPEPQPRPASGAGVGGSMGRARPGA